MKDGKTTVMGEYTLFTHWNMPVCRSKQMVVAVAWLQYSWLSAMNRVPKSNFLL